MPDSKDKAFWHSVSFYMVYPVMLTLEDKVYTFKVADISTWPMYILISSGTEMTDASIERGP